MRISPITKAISFDLAVVMFFLPAFTTPRTAQALQYDQETDLYFNRARTFNPKLGRFHQRDPHETALILMSAMRENAKTPMALVSMQAGAQYADGMSPYQYARSNPLTNRDPSGELLPLLLIGGAIAGALFSAGRIHATAADLDMEGPEYWRAIGVGALAGALFGLGLAGAGAVVGGLLGVGATTGTAYVSTMYGVNAFCRGAANRYQAENDIDAALANMEMAGGGLMTIGGAYTALRGGVPMWRGGRGYPTFNAMKADLGSAGAGQAWHHIVEQSPANIAKFGAEAIHNTNNVIRLPHGKGSVHGAITSYYQTKPPFADGLTIRQWLSTKSYAEQFQFGLEALDRFGVKPRIVFPPDRNDD